MSLFSKVATPRPHHLFAILLFELKKVMIQIWYGLGTIRSSNDVSAVFKLVQFHFIKQVKNGPTSRPCRFLARVLIDFLKFIYSEKATNFFKIFT